MSIFDKWDKNVDTEGLQKDIAEAEANGGQGDYREVPVGTYEVKIDKMEIKECGSEKHAGEPMFTVQFRILEGDFENSCLFMNDRMIQVWMDIEAPLYWWKEFDTYKIGTVANSCSTMHKIHSRDLTLQDFSTEHLSKTNLIVVDMVIDAINNARQDFLQNHDKIDWWQMIQLLPSSYNQKRTVMMNYEVIARIIEQRSHHKLDEWHQLVDVLSGLPYMKELIE